MGFFTAFTFLTILPVPFKGKDSGDISKSLAWFPLAGLVIGLLLAGIYWLLNLVLPSGIAVGLVLAASAAVSGGMHLDGLADTCDGLAGNRSIDERLSIMRDSRVGALAVIGVSLVILLKYVSLNSLPSPLILTAIVLMPVLSRWAMVYSVTAFPYVRPAGMGFSFKAGASWAKFAASSLAAATATLVITFFSGLTYFYLVSPALILGVWLVTFVCSVYLKRKFSGLTGDMYGAVSEVIEISVPLIILALLPVTAGAG